MGNPKTWLQVLFCHQAAVCPLRSHGIIRGLCFLLSARGWAGAFRVLCHPLQFCQGSELRHAHPKSCGQVLGSPAFPHHS